MKVCFPDPGLPDPRAIGIVRSVGSRILGREKFFLWNFWERLWTRRTHYLRFMNSYIVGTDTDLDPDPLKR